MDAVANRGKTDSRPRKEALFFPKGLEKATDFALNNEAHIGPIVQFSKGRLRQRHVSPNGVSGSHANRA